MSLLFPREKAAVLPTKLLLAIALMLAASLAVAQSNLGELLDAGGRKLSGQEFKQELVGRPIAGPTASGANIEVIYIDNGRIIGAGFASVLGGATGGAATYAVEGSWTIDDSEKICTSIQLGKVFLPRCQFWFKSGEQYYLSDSDSDRQARVLRRTVKP